jgi:hypothetical protein
MVYVLLTYVCGWCTLDCSHKGEGSYVCPGFLGRNSPVPLCPPPPLQAQPQSSTHFSSMSEATEVAQLVEVAQVRGFPIHNNPARPSSRRLMGGHAWVLSRHAER